jgi:hypothetical protein
MVGKGTINRSDNTRQKACNAQVVVAHDLLLTHPRTYACLWSLEATYEPYVSEPNPSSSLLGRLGWMALRGLAAPRSVQSRCFFTRPSDVDLVLTRREWRVIVTV